jgi:hypothetical protein
MSQKHSSDFVPLVTSFGLFLLTTVVSQWVRQRQLQPRDDYRYWEGEEDIEDGDDDRRDRYENRRVQGRLSYENLHHVLSHLDASNLPPCAAIGSVRPTSQDENLRLSEWDLNRQGASAKRRSNPTFPELARRDSELVRRDSLVEAGMEIHPNAHYDFHPKNRNWRHFEHFNEKDRARYIEKLSDSQRKQLETADLDVAKADRDCEESDTSFDDAQTISSEGSGSSEEQFVWMKHNHRQRDSDSSTPWPEMLRRKVSSGLTQLFEKPTSENDSYPQPTTNPPLHTAESSRSTVPSLIPNDATVRHRNQKHAMARRTMSSPDLGVPLPKLKRLLSTSTEPPSPDDESSQPKAEINNRILRAQYNAHIMPEKLVMIRHGQSMGNINELLYSTTPDNAMPLTDLGWKQARESGKILKEKILGTGQSVHFIVSPYVRTVETFHGLVSAWCDPAEFHHIKDKEKRIKAWYGRLIEMGLTWNEDSRIREQDFGNYQVSSVNKTMVAQNSSKKSKTSIIL